ncbi:threonine-phosphate decarboxylase CobD [Sphingomonas oligoaromativorans]|uniref:threonine-phosphate decarboxylase CobD n=1 Tax=Sphingomonas oligoaromativorans TaxID=575322 RepID=UPI00141E1FD4|nr:threonine-phosphate decarboxylase CobD [Sphingomonas oligoaromativorans]NIJ33925.1 cobalamin biosynthetic protein CobC [Sphingomonas oligoaromativorans]
MDGWRLHGGRLAAARAAWPDAPEPWLDLSTGINPTPWPVDRAGSIDWTRLPDEEALAGLEAAAARRFGVAAERVCALPGSEIGLRLLGVFGLPEPVRHQSPGYRTHAEAFGTSTPVDAADLVAEAGRGGTILLANPSNPDGRLHSPLALAALSDRLAAAGGRLIVDEAFADAMPGTSLLPLIEAGGAREAIVLRSFGKIYGLAGVRLGFMVAAPEWLAAMRRRLGSWPVSAAAITIGTAAYRDDAWLAGISERLPSERDRLDAVLRRHGLEPEGACPLFRLVRTPDAGALFERLARRGILTRPFDYAPDWLRIGLPGGEAALARLDEALAHG